MSSQQHELNNQLVKNRFLEIELKSQVEAVAVKKSRILVLDVGLTKANQELSKLNARYKELQAEHICQFNYILEQQSTITKGVEESGKLQKDLNKVQDTLAYVEQSST